MEERPSKYHKRSYTGVKQADGSKYEWFWESTHEDLKPTSTFQIGSTHYCSYCCKKAYPIQARLREAYSQHRAFELTDWDYETTGYCCICESAEKEKRIL